MSSRTLGLFEAFGEFSSQGGWVHYPLTKDVAFFCRPKEFGGIRGSRLSKVSTQIPPFQVTGSCSFPMRTCLWHRIIGS